MGKYSDEINRNRSSMSPEQINAAKCAKKKARNEWRQQENDKLYQEKKLLRDKLSPEEKMKLLDFRLGKGIGASRERGRLFHEMKHGKRTNKTNPKTQKEVTQPSVVETQEVISTVNIDEKTGRKILVPILTWAEITKGIKPKK